MKFSTQASSAADPKRAIKIFYKAIEVDDHEDVDVVSLPENAFLQLKRSLDVSNACLPPLAQSFREWRVGLLERFELLS